MFLPPTHPLRNVMKIFMNIFCLSFSFRGMKIDSFPFLSLASISVQLESALNSLYQRQPSRGVLRKMCSENVQQIYRITPMPKCDLLNLHLNMGVLLLITWLSEICLMSLVALFWNFQLLWSHSKNIWMSALVTIIITFELLIINYYYNYNYKKSQ